MKEKLYYVEEGKENNEAIIFIHSNLLSNWVWNRQKNQFKDYHCIYLDLIDHGKTQVNMVFSIENCKKLIKNLIINDLKYKKVHLVGIAIGGTIILDLLYKYPNIIETAVISGVNIKNFADNEYNIDDIEDKVNKKSIDKLKMFDEIKNIDNIIINQEDKRTEELLSSVKECKINILDKKPSNFIISGFLAEYGIGKEYFNQLKETIKIDNFIKVSEEYLKYRLPNEINNFPHLLILYGTKEYPKVAKSAELIQNQFPKSKIFSIYMAIHLWNIINCDWFNETIIEFIVNKNIKDKDYIKENKDKK
ncbi:MAG: alpha/beta hydrolase [Methanobrevibacter sp. CfCl-M3]